MGKNVTTVATPGAAAPAEPQEPAQTAATGGENKQPEVVQDLPPDLQAVVNKAIADGIAKALAQAKPAAVAPKPAVPSNLPRYEDVEREQKARPVGTQTTVLTDKGWYVADNPLPPNVNKAF